MKASRINVFFIMVIILIHFGIQGCALPRCQTCAIYPGIPRRFRFEDSAVELVSSPVRTFYAHQIVLIKSHCTNNWEYGIVNETPQPNSFISIHACSNHAELFCEPNEVRIADGSWRFAHPESVHPDTFRATLAQFLSLPNMQETPRKAFGLIKFISRNPVISVTGDLHGSITSLRNNWKRREDEVYTSPETERIDLYTGDYIDRGPFSTEVVHALMQLKIERPDNTILLQGNHESPGMSTEFATELREKIESKTGVEHTVNHLFSQFPHVTVFCVEPEAEDQPYDLFLSSHGGIDWFANLNEGIKQAIGRHKSDGITSHEYDIDYPENRNHGLLWSDFYANKIKNESPEAQPAAGRGDPEILSYNTSSAVSFLAQHSSDDPKCRYRMIFWLRAHQHIAGGITRLRQVAKPEGHASPDWKQLKDKWIYTINQGDVFTCTSSPEGLACKQNYQPDAFAIIRRMGGSWTITPYISRREV